MQRKGFNGGYRYARVGGSGNRFHEKPLKNEYSHPHDALQYLLLGGGEHYVILGHDEDAAELQHYALDHEPVKLYGGDYPEGQRYAVSE